MTEGAGGPQIVVQGADQAGSEFKITLAQQLLLAQHLLNQVQTQRLGRGGASGSEGEQDAEQPQITTGKLRGFRCGWFCFCKNYLTAELNAENKLTVASARKTCNGVKGRERYNCCQ